MTRETDPRDERALLRAELEELVVENAYLLDRGRFAEILDLFTEDCEVSRPALPFTGPELETIRGRAALAEWHSGPAWPPNPRTMRHVVSNLRIGRATADRVSATVTWTGYRHEGPGISLAAPMAVGDYEDEYRRGPDGRWRIHRRKIIIAFLNQQLLDLAVATAQASMTDAKFELASKAWFDEAFRLFREAAAKHREVTFSFCEVFTKVPERLGPDVDGKIAWHARVEGGRVDFGRTEVPAESVDVKTIAEWEAVLPAARAKIELDPEGMLRYRRLTEEATAQGRIRRFGDPTKAPLAFFHIHNALAEKTL